MSLRDHRVMWLLNHASARAFEVPMLKRVGYSEIFLPKVIPNDPMFRSANITFEEDAKLTIPKDELDIINKVNWYSPDDLQAWDIANRHFSAIFCIAHSPGALRRYCRHFTGLVIWRAYGLDISLNYAELYRLNHSGRPIPRASASMPWLGVAYSHIPRNEPKRWQERSVYLPLGMSDVTIDDGWNGDEARIFFVCPDIGPNSYYRNVYERFKNDFRGLPYVIGGGQPIAVNDPNVLGFVPSEVHKRNMQSLRVMFYHSREPNHVHFHPFEAVRCGMPLVFMSDGMLDRLGGKDLPGRCKSIPEARRKVQRLLDGDRTYSEILRSTQIRLMHSMSTESALPHWQAGINRLRAAMPNSLEVRSTQKRHRIAVILPIAYRGGTLRGARLLAHALLMGSRAADETAEIVFAYPRESGRNEERLDVDPIDGIHERSYQWRELSRFDAQSAMSLAGFDWQASADHYMVPSEEIHDCDLWLVVSDRISLPLLPLKPFVFLIFDYLQRYFDVLPKYADLPFIANAQRAERILVTTRFTEQDALQYAGLARERVVKVPMLAPSFPTERHPDKISRNPYFVWTTNAAPHKNHMNALKALIRYYEELDGSLDCVVTGVNSLKVQAGSMAHLHEISGLLKGRDSVNERIHWKGELDEIAYQRTLAGAAFLWHPGRLDNGTFSVIEAAHFGVPSLSSDYPAMREIDEQFSLRLVWMDASDAGKMADQLSVMGCEYRNRRLDVPTKEILASQSVENLAPAYWNAIRPCL